VCVATLRAAGIPSRPVIGLTNKNFVGTYTSESRYMVWAEYALPGAGWVPFDPKRMQGTVDRVLLKDQWQGLGSMPFLNTRIPIAFSFVVDGVKNAYDAIGPWSWIPIYKDRPLPVPQNFNSIPWYQTANEETYLLVPYSPSTQQLGVVSLGSGTSTPPKVEQQ
jgi:transglutaminase-like putative cysteine protease